MSELLKLKDLDVLADIEVHVRVAGGHAWTPATIKAHMDAEAAKLPGNIWWHVERSLEYLLGDGAKHLVGRSLCGGFYVGLLVMLVCLVCGIVFGGAVAMGSTATWVGLSFNFSIVGCFGGVAMALGAIGLSTVDVLAPAHWVDHKWHPSKPYLKNTVIPGTALDMARRLVAQLPDMTFIVSKLERPGHMGLFDPVLFALAQGPDGPKTRYPMCAWNPDGSIIEPPKLQVD